MTKIPSILYRGGTSKGPLILATDLPCDNQVLDRVLLAAMGSPHPRQIDGIGGAEILTSKVAIVGRSSHPDADVDYLFAQLLPDSSEIDYFALCGNMLSAVGPFAIERGLVPVDGKSTRVRIFNLNTSSLITVMVATPDGEVTYDGDQSIDGVNGTAAPLIADFSATAGCKTGALLPTGNPVDRINGIDVTCIDAANPAIIVAADSLSISGAEEKAELDGNQRLIELLQELRIAAGFLMGLGDCRNFVLPKPIVVSRPRNGGSITGRDFVPDRCHAAFSVTGSIALSAACLVPGSVAQRVTGLAPTEDARISIEHPFGFLNVDVGIRLLDGIVTLEKARTIRTCRKLFDGNIFVPSWVWDGSGRALDAVSIYAGCRQ